MEDKFGWTNVAAVEPKIQFWTFQNPTWPRTARKQEGLCRFTATSSSSPRPFPPPQLPPPLDRINPDPSSAPSSPALGTLILLMPLHLSLHTSNLEKNQNFGISQASDLASGATGHILGEFGVLHPKTCYGQNQITPN